MTQLAIFLLSWYNKEMTAEDNSVHIELKFLQHASEKKLVKFWEK